MAKFQYIPHDLIDEYQALGHDMSNYFGVKSVSPMRHPQYDMSGSGKGAEDIPSKYGIRNWVVATGAPDASGRVPKRLINMSADEFKKGLLKESSGWDAWADKRQYRPVGALKGDPGYDDYQKLLAQDPNYAGARLSPSGVSEIETGQGWDYGSLPDDVDHGTYDTAFNQVSAQELENWRKYAFRETKRGNDPKGIHEDWTTPPPDDDGRMPDWLKWTIGGTGTAILGKHIVNALQDRRPQGSSTVEAQQARSGESRRGGRFFGPMLRKTGQALGLEGMRDFFSPEQWEDKRLIELDRQLADKEITQAEYNETIKKGPHTPVSSPEMTDNPRRLRVSGSGPPGPLTAPDPTTGAPTLTPDGSPTGLNPVAAPEAVVEGLPKGWSVASDPATKKPYYVQQLEGGYTHSQWEHPASVSSPAGSPDASRSVDFDAVERINQPSEPGQSQSRPTRRGPVNPTPVTSPSIDPVNPSGGPAPVSPESTPVSSPELDRVQSQISDPRLADIMKDPLRSTPLDPLGESAPEIIKDYQRNPLSNAEIAEVASEGKGILDLVEGFEGQSLDNPQTRTLKTAVFGDLDGDSPVEHRADPKSLEQSHERTLQKLSPDLRAEYDAMAQRVSGNVLPDKAGRLISADPLRRKAMTKLQTDILDLSGRIHDYFETIDNVDGRQRFESAMKSNDMVALEAHRKLLEGTIESNLRRQKGGSGMHLDEKNAGLRTVGASLRADRARLLEIELKQLEVLLDEVAPETTEHKMSAANEMMKNEFGKGSQRARAAAKTIEQFKANPEAFEAKMEKIAKQSGRKPPKVAKPKP